MTTVTTDYIVVTAGNPPEHDHGSWSQHPDTDLPAIWKLAQSLGGALYLRTITETGGTTNEMWERINMTEMADDEFDPSDHCPPEEPPEDTPSLDLMAFHGPWHG